METKQRLAKTTPKFLKYQSKMLIDLWLLEKEIEVAFWDDDFESALELTKLFYQYNLLFRVR